MESAAGAASRRTFNSSTATGEINVGISDIDCCEDGDCPRCAAELHPIRALQEALSIADSVAATYRQQADKLREVLEELLRWHSDCCCMGCRFAKEELGNV